MLRVICNTYFLIWSNKITEYLRMHELEKPLLSTEVCVIVDCETEYVIAG